MPSTYDSKHTEMVRCVISGRMEMLVGVRMEMVVGVRMEIVVGGRVEKTEELR